MGKVARDETLQECASALKVIAMNTAGQVIGIQNWDAIQNNVRGGLGPVMYPIGTQFIVEKETSLAAAMGVHSGITAVTVDEETFLTAEGIVGSGIHEFIYHNGGWRYEDELIALATYGLTVTGTPEDGDEIIVTEAFNKIIFDVVDHRTVKDIYTGKEKPAMILLMHHCIYGRAFDATEAIIYAEEEIPAGTHHFALLAGYDTANDGGKNVQFTLTKPVPAGGQIVMSWPSSATWIGRNITTYESATSTTAIETAVMSEGTDGTDLGTADGSSANVNHTHRARYGSNNYAESALRQWINSDAPANEWWKPSNKFDRPVGYTNAAGLLHGMDADFLKVVSIASIPCKTNNTFEMEGWEKNTAYTLKDRFFLPSRNEIGFGTENVAEGATFAMYNGVENVDRIKYDLSAQATARSWWHRSPNPGNANLVRYTNSTGALNSSHAYNGYGAAAACEIS